MSAPTRRAVLGLGALPLTAAVGGCSVVGDDGAGDAGPGSSGGAPSGTEPEILTYGEGPSQTAELFRPDGPPRGRVVVLHGGFWLGSYDLSLGRPLARDLAARGWLALNVEYRRVGGGGGVPATLDDVSAAVDLLGDTGAGPVVTLGHSAGGQIAVWAAGRQRLPRWRDARVTVTHAVSQAGVLDLAGGAATDLGNGAVVGFLGGTPQQVPRAYAMADPLAQVPLEVPVWCVHGRDDDIVPIEQSRVYVRAATAAGGRATLVETVGGHLDQIDVEGDPWSRTVEVLETIAPAGS